MGNQPRKRIVGPTARPARRPMKEPRSSRPEWLNGALLDAALVIGTTLGTTLFLLLISGQVQDTTVGSLIARSPAPALDQVITPEPTPEPTLPKNLIPSPQPSRPAASPSPATDPNNDASTHTTDDAIQAAIDKKLQDIAELSSYGITITIDRGTVTVAGTVPSDEVKGKIEKLVRAVNGVKQVENQLVVVSGN